MMAVNFYDVSNDWLKYKQSTVKHLSYEKYLNIVQKHLSYFKDKNIEDLQENEIKDFFYFKEHEEHLSHGTLKIIKQVMKSIFDYCSYEYSIELFDISDIRFKQNVKSTMVLTNEEKEKIQMYVNTHTNQLSLAILLSLFAGLRVGEICALRKENIDLKNGFISIKESVERIKQKDGNSELILLEPRSKASLRHVPMSSFVKEFFEKYLTKFSMKNNDYILSQSEKIYEPRLLQRNLKELGSTMNIKTNFSILRDTFISNCLHSNMNIKCLCQIIGNVNFAGIYELCPETSDEQKRNEMERITIDSMKRAT